MKKIFGLILILILSININAQCIQGDCKNGQGTYLFKSGSKFNGQWQNGQMKNGTYHYSNGEKYVGDFYQGKRQGQGTYYYNSGNKFIGNYINGKKTNGTMYYARGGTYKGQYKNDKKNGKGTLTLLNNIVFDGYWRNNEYLGKTESANSSNYSIETFAVIVGVADYLNNHLGIGDLTFTITDARLLKEFLINDFNGGLPSSNVTLLLNSQATKANILSAMQSVYAKADENDRIIFYFSGHGMPGAFVPYDASREPTSMLYHDEIKTAFKKTKSKYKFICADACYSGSVKALPNLYKKLNQLSETNSKALPADQEVAVLLSSTGDEVSYENGRIGQGIFSYYLIKALNGSADENRDRTITYAELYYYVRDNTYYYVKQNVSKPHKEVTQTPIMYGKFERHNPFCTY